MFKGISNIVRCNHFGRQTYLKWHLLFYTNLWQNQNIYSLILTIITSKEEPFYHNAIVWDYPGSNLIFDYKRLWLYLKKNIKTNEAFQFRADLEPFVIRLLPSSFSCVSQALLEKRGFHNLLPVPTIIKLYRCLLFLIIHRLDYSAYPIKSVSVFKRC